MGSSALGATRFRQRVQSLGLDRVEIGYASVSSVPNNADIVVCMEALAGRAKASAPQARIIELHNFLDDPALDNLYNEFASLRRGVGSASAGASVLAGGSQNSFPILRADSVIVGAKAADKWEAIREAGNLLVKGGYVGMNYVDAMVEREKITTTYLGMGIAIPHGTGEAKKEVYHTGIAVVQYPEGVSFGDEKAQLVIAIAGVGDEHLELLARLSEALEDEAVLRHLKSTAQAQDILDVLA